jgi:hypothetical protein
VTDVLSSRTLSRLLQPLEVTSRVPLVPLPLVMGAFEFMLHFIHVGFFSAKVICSLEREVALQRMQTFLNTHTHMHIQINTTRSTQCKENSVHWPSLCVCALTALAPVFHGMSKFQ